MLRKFKQLLSNFEAETRKKLSNLRLAEKRVAYKIESSVNSHKLEGYFLETQRSC